MEAAIGHITCFLGDGNSDFVGIQEFAATAATWSKRFQWNIDGNTIQEMGGYIVIASSERHDGVAIAILAKYKPYIHQVRSSAVAVALEIPLPGGKVEALISAHIPTDERFAEYFAIFVDTLAAVRHAGQIILLIDANLHVASSHAQEAVGQCCPPTGNFSHRLRMFYETLRAHDLVLANTVGQYKVEDVWTWQSYASRERRQNDYVAIRRHTLRENQARPRREWQVRGDHSPIYMDYVGTPGHEAQFVNQIRGMTHCERSREVADKVSRAVIDATADQGHTKAIQRAVAAFANAMPPRPRKQTRNKDDDPEIEEAKKEVGHRHRAH